MQASGGKMSPSVCPAFSLPLPEDSEIQAKTLPQGHSRVFNVFSRAFRCQNVQFEKAIQSLDSLNDQIVEFVLHDLEDNHGADNPRHRETLRSSMALMRRLLVDAQNKFRKMVDENKQLASRIDGELQTAHQEVHLLRQELADTNRRINEMQSSNSSGCKNSTSYPESFSTEENGIFSRDNFQNCCENSYASSLQSSLERKTCTLEELLQLRAENEKLSAQNRDLERELQRVKETSVVSESIECVDGVQQMGQLSVQLTHAKEALSALKTDRKRLKAEKFDLLNQMKQLYATLEDKEKELRDFIRNYEQRMKETDESLRQLAQERDQTEREKWNILKHARDEAEKVVSLSAQLGVKEAYMKKLQDELESVRRQLANLGYQSDAESVRTNGLPTPTATTPTCSPLPITTPVPTPTPNGRGSSADSGVRLSSDRDSMASHEGRAQSPLKDSSSAIYATPMPIRENDSEHVENEQVTTPVSAESAGLSSNVNRNCKSELLSHSFEQLCGKTLTDGGPLTSKGKIGLSSTLSRKGNKVGGTWGSISRVFARQKKRAALDPSLFEGGSVHDKRASWSPNSSLCVSPLTEESYSEKLKLLEEAQHVALERWRAPTVQAWLEITLGMPQYGSLCAENIRSGKVLLELNDCELENGLGITQPMHRKKLRLAIEEMRHPRLTRFPRISLLTHTWVASDWLSDLGLLQYAESFSCNLVDGRMLESLTKKELEKYLGVQRKFHQASFLHGIHLLRMLRFDRQLLAERRRQCEYIDSDPIVWSNQRLTKWVRNIDLVEYADHLKDSGVHGALLILEPSFTPDTMATALGIPQSKNIVRRHLSAELDALISPARRQFGEHAKYAKMERRRLEKLASGGSLGRSFSRSYGTLDRGEKDKKRSSLRGSLSRALGLKIKEEINGGESSSSGNYSPTHENRNNVLCPQGRPWSSVIPTASFLHHHETHRRVRSISDIEQFTVTPV